MACELCANSWGTEKHGHGFIGELDIRKEIWNELCRRGEAATTEVRTKSIIMNYEAMLGDIAAMTMPLMSTDAASGRPKAEIHK